MPHDQQEAMSRGGLMAEQRQGWLRTVSLPPGPPAHVSARQAGEGIA